MGKIVLGVLFSLSLGMAVASPLQIVAAENFYGELASEIGGSVVQVQSIINNPDADPHLFATSPSTSKALASAKIIIYNGADYDNWMQQLLASQTSSRAIIINVADLMGIKSGQNPHLWYKPETFPKLAQELAAKINQLVPQAKNATQLNLLHFLHSNAPVQAAIQAAKAKYAGSKVTATEPVFGYMATAMGLKMEGLDFQWKIMNDSEPAPKMIVNFQNLLNTRQVKVLFYNNQVSDALTQNMQQLARHNQIPVVGISETLPKNMPLNDWLMAEVTATTTALAGGE